MYSNIIKTTITQQPLKVSPQHPKLARHLPYQIECWYMMIWPYWCIENIIKNNSNPSAFKSVTRAPKIGTSSPIPDTMMIYDDLTILMYRNIIKNNSYPLPRKVWPEPPKLGRHLPYQIQWWYKMIWPYWWIETSSKTSVTHCLQKCDQSPQNWDVISHTRYNDDIWWSDHTDV